MPVVAVPAVFVAFAALLALLILFGVKYFGQAFAGLIPSDIPIIGNKLHNAVLAIASVAEAALTWVMGQFIRPVINFVLAPVYRMIDFVDSVYSLARTMAASWSWLLNSAIPSVISKVQSYAHALVVAARAYSVQLYHTATKYAHGLVVAARAYALALYNTLHALAYHLYRVGETFTKALVRAEVAALSKSIGLARTYAEGLVRAARQDLTKMIRHVEAEVSAIGGITAATVAAEVAAGVRAAESYAAGAVSEAITAVDIDAIKDLSGLFDGLIIDVGALEDVIATDLPDIGAAVRAIPRAIPGDIAESIALTGAVSIAAVRYMRQCGVPNCRNLGGVGRALRDIFNLVEGGALIALIAELVHDPEGTAHVLHDGLGDLVDSGIGAAKSTLGF